MDTKVSLISLCFLLTQGGAKVESAIVSAKSTVDTKDDVTLTVRCDVTVSSDEQFRVLKLSRGSAIIAHIGPSNLIPSLDPNARGIYDRILEVSGSRDGGHLNFRVTDNTCAEEGQTYTCALKVMRIDSRQTIEQEEWAHLSNGTYANGCERRGSDVTTIAYGVSAGLVLAALAFLAATAIFAVISIRRQNERLKRLRRRRQIRQNRATATQPADRSHTGSPRLSALSPDAAGGGYANIPAAAESHLATIGSSGIDDGPYEVITGKDNPPDKPETGSAIARGKPSGENHAQTSGNEMAGDASGQNVLSSNRGQNVYAQNTKQNTSSSGTIPDESVDRAEKKIREGDGGVQSSGKDTSPHDDDNELHIYDVLRVDEADAGTYTKLQSSSGSVKGRLVSVADSGCQVAEVNNYDTLLLGREDMNDYTKLRMPSEAGIAQSSSRVDAPSQASKDRLKKSVDEQVEHTNDDKRSLELDTGNKCRALPGSCNNEKSG